jgi:hypothetical protein
MMVSGTHAQRLRQPLSVQPTGFNYNLYQAEVASPSDQTADSVADEFNEVATPESAPHAVGSSVADHDYGYAAASSCACAAPSCGGCGSCDSCCDSGCGLGSCLSGSCLGGCLADCCLGDAWTLSGHLHGDCEPTVTIGGWFAAGYYDKSNGLFNSTPNRLNVTQSWLYAEKTADESSPWGFRADIMYGTDADDTQAFGNPAGSWDFQNGFDHGVYGWAIPQLYAEVLLGEWSVKAGHFYTLVGYEVVTAPDNFFFSHALTMYNSEPFTHTGVVASRSLSDNLEIHAGWTLGWDTGFDQFDGGSSWLGGFSYTLMEDATFTYISTAGNFGKRGDNAYSHSMVLDMKLTENFNWVVQSDMVRVNEFGEDNIGLNQYFLYTVSDCIGLGARVEWWKADNITGYAPHGSNAPATGSQSYYEATFGVNARPHANVVFRPEVRYDWSPGGNYNEAIFGIDTVMTF